MLNVKFHPLIQSASGTLKKGSDEHFRHYKKSDKTFICKRKEDYQYTRTPKQRTMRDDFGARSRAATQWLHANRNPPTAEYLALRRDFESQMKYDNFFTYLMSRLPDL